MPLEHFQGNQQDNQEEKKEDRILSGSPKSSAGEMWDSAKSFVWETLKVIIIALAIIIPVRYYLIQPFYVKGASMEPNFYDHEYLIIDEISYRFNAPRRGEVIVFKYPKDTSGFFIKRIIGLPNERIRISDGKITIYSPRNPQGVVLDENKYLDKDLETLGSIDITLAPNEYYVLGDNRMSSLDSRRFGPLESKYIVGKVWVRGWPLDRAGTFPEFSYSGL